MADNDRDNRIQGDDNQDELGGDWKAAWETEDNYWEENFCSRPYALGPDYYDRFRPAYRYGFESARHDLGRSWDDAEPDLRTGWERYQNESGSPSAWEEIKDAVRDAWDRVTGGRVVDDQVREVGARSRARRSSAPDRPPGPYLSGMADSIRDLFFGAPARELVEAVEPQRSFDDVVLPERTLRALNHALALVRKHDLIFRQWGLAERHSTGLGLAFHFAGPPGTGKTICAEALAYTLRPEAARRALLRARVALGGPDRQARGLGVPRRRAAGRRALLRRGRRHRRPPVHRACRRPSSARPTRS